MFVRATDRRQIKAGRPRSLATTTELRECPHHGLAPFHRIRDGERYRWQCSGCVGERVTRRHRFMRATLLDEAGGRCAACGYDRCTANLHFHHVDPTTKAFAVNMRYGRSLKAYREEAKKCVLLCATRGGGVRPAPVAARGRALRGVATHSGGTRLSAPAHGYKRGP
jgi:hypothetical protein